MYGRGVGKIPSSCDDGEDKVGALCYPECKDGFSGSIDWCREDCKDSYHNTGLTCFRPAKSKGNGCKGHCDDGYHNTGCTCFRPADSYTAKAYYRGAGNPLACSSGQDKDAGLCYKQCKDGYSGSGPVCWLHGYHSSETKNQKCETLYKQQ